MPAHLVHRLRDLVAGRPVRDDDVRDLAIARPRRDRHACADVRSGVRDEDLRAVDRPGAVAQLRRRPRRAGIGPGARLGQPERGEPLSGGELRQPLLLLLLVPEVVDRERP